MIAPCDFYVKVYLPSIKAKIARILYLQFNKKQEDIAKMLGITQAAASKYISGKFSRKIWGLINNKELDSLARKYSKELIEKNYVEIQFSKEICKFCERCKE